MVRIIELESAISYNNSLVRPSTFRLPAYDPLAPRWRGQ